MGNGATLWICSLSSLVNMKMFVRVADFAGFSQGVRRSVGGLATILGPLWAGGLTDNMYVMMGVMVVLLVMLSVSKEYKAFINHQRLKINVCVSVCIYIYIYLNQILKLSGENLIFALKMWTEFYFSFICVNICG